MTLIIRAFPLVRDRREVLALGKELKRGRGSETDDFYRRFGVTSERWFLQDAHAGSLLIVSTETDDPATRAHEYAAANHPFESWFKEQVLADESGAPLRGPEGFKAFFHKFREAFPDIEVSVDDIITEGDKVAARCTVRATHTGDSLGIEATHKTVEFKGMTMLRVSDGQIAEAWNNFDFLNLFQQLGVM